MIEEKETEITIEGKREGAQEIEEGLMKGQIETRKGEGTHLNRLLLRAARADLLPDPPPDRQGHQVYRSKATPPKPTK
jgi:hypothetical protein